MRGKAPAGERDDSGDLVRILEPVLHDQGAAPGMADQDRALDTEPRQGSMDEPRLSRRAGVPLATTAMAISGAIEGEDPKAAGQRGARGPTE